MATAAGFVVVLGQVRLREEVRFKSHVESLQRTMVERMQNYTQVLKGAAGLFAASESVEPGEWRAYFEKLELNDRFRGVRALGFVENLTSTNLLREHPGASGTGPTPRGPKMLPAGSSDAHYIVKYVEPMEDNRAAVGYDLASEPARCEALEEARETGEAVLTRKIKLVQAPYAGPGVLLVLPIYANSAHSVDLNERRAALQGWVYAAFVIKDLLAGIPGFASHEVEAEIYDGLRTGPETCLYSSDGNTVRPGRGQSQRGNFDCVVTTLLNHRTWTLRCAAKPAFFHATSYALPFCIAIGGLNISLLAFGVIRSLLTSRKRAEMAANQMTSQLRLQERAMMSSHEGFFILDAGREGYPIVYTNPAFRQITGYTTEECQKRTAVLPRGNGGQPDLPRLRAALKTACEERNIMREYRKDGTPFWAEFSLWPVHDEQGRTTHFVGILDDITERKRVEAAARENQERFALAVRGTNDGIWDWNVATNEVYFSPRWKSMLGYEDDEVENTFSGWEALLHPEDRERALAQIQAYFAGETGSYEVEHRLRHKDGSYRWILARGVALRDDNGRPLRMAGSHLDLTERKQAEEELRRANAELARSRDHLKRMVENLKRLNRELESTQLQLIQAAKLESVGILAAGVAHEVKNPLQTILFAVAYLEKSGIAKAEEPKSVLQEMRDAVQRASTIIRELLHFSSATRFELKEGNLNEALDRSLALVHNEVIASRIRVVRDFAPDLPRAEFDPDKLEQVFINLFINAIQAMSQEGTLSVRTRGGELGMSLQLSEGMSRQFRTGETLVLAEVRDDGPGIPPEILAKIFDPFFTTKPRGLGTGLGLSVVRRIIDLHGGCVDVANVEGGGAQVTVVLRGVRRAEPNHNGEMMGI